MAASSTHRRLPAAASGYELREQIGQGSCAAVYRAWCEEIKDEVAVKVVELELVHASLEDIGKEIQVMSLSSHPNVVPFSTAFVQASDLWIVMPLLTGGSVLSLMTCAFPSGLPEDHAVYILWCVLNALEYFHGHGQIHRDIKAANLLLDSHGSAMLSDYGMMGWMVEGGWDRKQRQTFTGSPCWMAPEVMEQSSGYDYKADIWSLGITAIELADGRAPYTNFAPMKILFLTLQNPSPTLSSSADKYSATYKDFVATCLQKDPKHRPTAKQLLSHPLFAGGAKKPDTLADTIAKLPPIGSRGGSQKQLIRQLQKTNAPQRSGIYDLKRQGLGWDFGDNDNEENAPLSADNDVVHESNGNASPQESAPNSSAASISPDANVQTAASDSGSAAEISSVRSIPLASPDAGLNPEASASTPALSQVPVASDAARAHVVTASAPAPATRPHQPTAVATDGTEQVRRITSNSSGSMPGAGPAKPVGLLKKGRFTVSDVRNPEKLDGKIDSFLDTAESTDHNSTNGLSPVEDGRSVASIPSSTLPQSVNDSKPGTRDQPPYVNPPTQASNAEVPAASTAVEHIQAPLAQGSASRGSWASQEMQRWAPVSSAPLRSADASLTGAAVRQQNAPQGGVNTATTAGEVHQTKPTKTGAQVRSEEKLTGREGQPSLPSTSMPPSMASGKPRTSGGREGSFKQIKTTQPRVVSVSAGAPVSYAQVAAGKGKALDRTFISGVAPVVINVETNPRTAIPAAPEPPRQHGAQVQAPVVIHTVQASSGTPATSASSGVRTVPTSHGMVPPSTPNNQGTTTATMGHSAANHGVTPAPVIPAVRSIPPRPPSVTPSKPPPAGPSQTAPVVISSVGSATAALPASTGGMPQVMSGAPNGTPPLPTPIPKRKSRFEVKDVPVSSNRPMGSTSSLPLTSSAESMSNLSATSLPPASMNAAPAPRPRSRFEVKDVDHRPRSVPLANGMPPVVSIGPGSVGNSTNGSRQVTPVMSPQPEVVAMALPGAARQTMSLLSELQHTIQVLVNENESLKREVNILRSRVSTTSLADNRSSSANDINTSILHPLGAPQVPTMHHAHSASPILANPAVPRQVAVSHHHAYLPVLASPPYQHQPVHLYQPQRGMQLQQEQVHHANAQLIQGQAYMSQHMHMPAQVPTNVYVEHPVQPHHLMGQHQQMHATGTTIPTTAQLHGHTPMLHTAHGHGHVGGYVSPHDPQYSQLRQTVGNEVMGQQWGANTGLQEAGVVRETRPNPVVSGVSAGIARAGHGLEHGNPVPGTVDQSSAKAQMISVTPDPSTYGETSMGLGITPALASAAVPGVLGLQGVQDETGVSGLQWHNTQVRGMTGQLSGPHGLDAQGASLAAVMTSSDGPTGIFKPEMLSGQSNVEQQQQQQQ